MIPQGRLSTIPVADVFQFPDNLDPPNTLTDYEMGGRGLSDPSEGLQVHMWVATYNPDTGEVFLSAPNEPETVIFTALGLTEISLAFDQNMRPSLAYVQNEEAKFRWFDNTENDFVILELPIGSKNPRCCLDDKRDMQSSQGMNDVLLAYLRNGSLYYRQQRDRYLVEYLLKENLNGRLIRIGMNRQYRMQFYFEGVAPE